MMVAVVVAAVATIATYQMQRTHFKLLRFSLLIKFCTQANKIFVLTKVYDFNCILFNSTPLQMNTF